MTEPQTDQHDSNASNLNGEDGSQPQKDLSKNNLAQTDNRNRTEHRRNTA